MSIYSTTDNTMLCFLSLDVTEAGKYNSQSDGTEYASTINYRQSEATRRWLFYEMHYLLLHM